VLREAAPPLPVVREVGGPLHHPDVMEESRGTDIPYPPRHGAAQNTASATASAPLERGRAGPSRQGVARDSTSATAPGLARRPEPAAAQVRILVVEDVTLNQQVAQGMLAKLGYASDVAANGRVALDALSQGPYTAILMDLQMPEMDGFAATAEIRRREGDARHTPIIAVTANATAGDRERCLAAGMDDYVAKPVRVEGLAEVLRRWVPPTPALEATVTARAEPPAAGPADAPAMAADEPAVLDEAALVRLGRLRPQGPDPVPEYVGLFLEEAPSQLASIHAALAGSDPDAIRRAAHTLKGSARTIGAAALAARAEQIERHARAGALTAAAAEAPALDAAYARAAEALAARRDASVQEG
jgi:two-component system sensor histidine kinase/response regulator